MHMIVSIKGENYLTSDTILVEYAILPSTPWLPSVVSFIYGNICVT